MRDLLRYLNQNLERGRELILCQVVETRGSTPQKAGALMLVDPTGAQAGTLGGGCIEAEVKQKAIGRIGQTGAEVQTFVLDHDYAWADGLICGGKMVILTEALRGAEPLGYFRAFQALLESGGGFTEAVVVDPRRCDAGVALPAGARALVDPTGKVAAAWPIGADGERLAAGAIALADRPRPAVRDGVAFLPTLPRVRLVIVGAGHVGQGVASLAAQADFDVWVVDDRQQYANPERFPTAERIIVGPIDEVLPALEVTPQTYALIVTRGHGHDQEALYLLAPTRAPYVGLIGSRRKIRLIFDGLRDQGIAESDLARVAAPVGLDIGSQTIPEIAVSIVAELIARRNLGPDARAPRRRADGAVTPDETRAMTAAIVPAAGRSERMGQPKLILPIGGLSVIAHVTNALLRGGVRPVVVVVPPPTVAGAPALAAEAAGAGAWVVVAERPPPDMRASVELGLEHLAQRIQPPPATFLLAPGDSPGISAELVARIVAQAQAEPEAIVIPQSHGRRGHPIALPWSLAAEIRGLPGDVGINALVARHAARVFTLDVADPAALDDLDTPDDYRRWTMPRGAPGPGGMDAARSSHDDGNRVPAGALPGQPEERLVRVTVRLFALARQRAGRADVVLDVAAPATVAAVKRALAAEFPELAPLVPQLMIAIDSDYACDDQRPIPPGAEVAAIPPVSGGRPARPVP